MIKNFLKFIYDYVLGWFIVIVVILGLLSGFGRFVKYVNNRECQTKAEVMGFNYKYSRWTGCIIEVESEKWIPLGSYYYKEE